MSNAYVVNFNDVRRNADLYVPFQLAGTDITGGIFKLSLQNHNKVIVKTLTNGDGITIVDALTGKFAIQMSAASIFSLLPVGTYQHDLLYESVGGSVDRIWYGSMSVRSGITIP